MTVKCRKSRVQSVTEMYELFLSLTCGAEGCFTDHSGVGEVIWWRKRGGQGRDRTVDQHYSGCGCRWTPRDGQQSDQDSRDVHRLPPARVLPVVSGEHNIPQFKHPSTHDFTGGLEKWDAGHGRGAAKSHGCGAEHTRDARAIRADDRIACLAYPNSRGRTIPSPGEQH